MRIEYTDRYEEHGCCIRGNLDIIRYSSEVTNKEFNSANRAGGLYDYLDKAEALVQATHPDYKTLLTIPDLVFRFPLPQPTLGAKA